MKRIVSIQDVSCLGKCSQSVALPVLSAMGHECVILPTALLSAHTAFDGFVSRDLDFRPIAAHWQAIGLRFDAIYTGYLGAVAQVDRVLDFLRDFRAAKALVLVDPAMADHGRLYAGLSPELPARMAELCREADVITPNVSEACLLTGEPYREAHDMRFVRRLLERLLALGAGAAVLTGLRPDVTHVAVAAMSKGGMLTLHQTEYIPATLHGTGDLFASVCVGELLRGAPLEAAAAFAAQHVFQTVRATAADPDARWYGVSFETTLPGLMREKKEESNNGK